MKSHVSACRRGRPTAWGGLLLAPVLLAQSTNLINDGATLANLTLLLNQHGTGGATLTLAPDADGLRAEQTDAYPDFAVNGVWYADNVRPVTDAYEVLADVRPAEPFPERVIGVMGWLDPEQRRGITARVVPGPFGSFQVAVVDFTATSAAANDSAVGLFNQDGTEAQAFLGSAWGQFNGYDPAAFATVSLAFQPATAADRAVLSNATTRVVARLLQDGEPVAEVIELLSTLPPPAHQRVGYAGKLDTLVLPGGVLGYFKNLRVTGEIEIVNRPPIVALVSPTNGARFFAPASVTLRAEASDPDGTVTRVEFRQGNQLLGSATTLPASLTVSNLAEGSYTFTATAVDHQGASATSTPVTIEVIASPEPTLEAPQLMSGPDGLPQLRFTVAGTTGTPYEAQVSFDLQTWWTVARGALTQSRVELSLSAYADWGLAYYRVQVVAAGQGNQSPTVEISSPAPGTTFPAPASFNVSVGARDPEGQLARIEVYLGTRLVGTATTSPASIPVSGLTRGTYQLSARAVDPEGAGGISAPVRIEVAGQIVPPQLSAPTLLPSPGQFTQFQFTAGGLSGSSYRVESSSNLRDWTPVETGTVTGATRTFTYPRAAGNAPLFYRVVNLP